MRLALAIFTGGGLDLQEKSKQKVKPPFYNIYFQIPQESYILNLITHKHEHQYESLEHIHYHKHNDGHYDHIHENESLNTKKGYSHLHKHEPIKHVHPHYSDLHHRHEH